MKAELDTVLRWPLWSWRNLSITSAAVLLVLFGMGRVIEPAKLTLSPVRASATAAETPSLAATPVPSATATASAVPAPMPTSTSATAAVPGAPANESVTRVALGFAQAWSSSTRSQQQWTEGIKPFVSPALAAGLAQTDPARVPATKVNGEPVLVTASPTSAQVTVPTDGGSIVVTLSRASSTPWQVSDVGPADQPPGAPTPDLQPRSSPAPS
jgi:hypothetical protein